MNVLDLFSGIGGFSLGLERAGMRTAAFCEIEPYCRKVLRKHWPDTPIFEDVRKLDGTQYRGTVDLVCGGYPCQPFSMAGRRRGAEDERHLWPEMYRLIREIRPRWVVAENVAGHVSLGFDEVAASLEAEGFAVWPFIIPACAVGALHRRDRLWIVAHAEGERNIREAGKLCEAQRRPHHELPGQPDVASAVRDAASAGLPDGRRPSLECGRSQQESQRPDCLSGGASALADPGGSWLHEQRLAHDVEGEMPEPRGMGGDGLPCRNSAETKTLADTDNLDAQGIERGRDDKDFRQEPRERPARLRYGTGIDEFWALEPDVGRVAHGIPNRVDRLRALGNAIVPQIAEIIGRAILNFEQAIGGSDEGL